MSTPQEDLTILSRSLFAYPAATPVCFCGTTVYSYAISLTNAIGGSLLVWRKGKVTELNWTNEGDNNIHWAAFYSDCQHQVTVVTSGHRIPLTYNLFYSSVGNLAQPVADPKQLALCGMIKKMYEQPGF
jgi:hypothetical protein